MIVRAVRWLWRCNWVTGACTGASSRAMAPADRPRLAARWVMMACRTAAFSTGLRVELGPAFQMISPPAVTAAVALPCPTSRAAAARSAAGMTVTWSPAALAPARTAAAIAGGACAVTATVKCCGPPVSCTGIAIPAAVAISKMMVDTRNAVPRTRTASSRRVTSRSCRSASAGPTSPLMTAPPPGRSRSARAARSQTSPLRPLTSRRPALSPGQPPGRQ
jgi:hypothetical protein